MASLAAAQACWGFVTRRERWGLSLRGWIALAAAMLGAGWLFATTAYPFLATTDRIADADLLIVEGWVHPYAIRAAVAELEAHRYRRIVTTGGPVEGLGGYVNDYSTTASVAATRLRTAGIPTELVAMAPSRVIDRDRTYASAVALGDWLHDNAPEVRSINVVTADVHARRTQLLFQAALGPRVRVGVIAVRSVDYDPLHWWRYSEGVRAVLSEAIAYGYAKLFFHPAARPSDGANVQSTIAHSHANDPRQSEHAGTP